MASDGSGGSSKAGKARQEAISLLIKANQQQYDEIYAERRAAHGLGEKAGEQKRAQEKVAKLEQKLEEARQALAALS